MCLILPRFTSGILVLLYGINNCTFCRHCAGSWDLFLVASSHFCNGTKKREPKGLIMGTWKLSSQTHSGHQGTAERFLLWAAMFDKDFGNEYYGELASSTGLRHGLLNGLPAWAGICVSFTTWEQNDQYVPYIIREVIKICGMAQRLPVGLLCPKKEV